MEEHENWNVIEIPRPNQTRVKGSTPGHSSIVPLLVGKIRSSLQNAATQGLPVITVNKKQKGWPPQTHIAKLPTAVRQFSALNSLTQNLIRRLDKEVENYLCKEMPDDMMIQMALNPMVMGDCVQVVLMNVHRVDEDSAEIHVTKVKLCFPRPWLTCFQLK